MASNNNRGGGEEDKLLLFNNYQLYYLNIALNKSFKDKSFDFFYLIVDKSIQFSGNMCGWR